MYNKFRLFLKSSSIIILLYSTLKDSFIFTSFSCRMSSNFCNTFRFCCSRVGLENFSVLWDDRQLSFEALIKIDWRKRLSFNNSNSLAANHIAFGRIQLQLEILGHLVKEDIQNSLIFFFIFHVKTAPGFSVRVGCAHL